MQKIGALHLSYKNIVRKPLRSIGLIFLVALFSFALLAGSLMANSLAEGVATMSNRLGADVMVVPAGHEAKIASVLLRGSASPFYLPDDAASRLQDIAGIAALSPQLYVASDAQLLAESDWQVVGIDGESDFLISAWLTENSDFDALAQTNCIIGSDVSGSVGGTISILNQPYQIVGRLQQTGMSFDSTVFVDIGTARTILHAVAKQTPPQDGGNLSSALMIKLEPGYNSQLVAREISNKHADEGIFGMFSKKFVNSISSNLQVIMRFVKFAIVAIWLLSSVVLTLVFTMMIRERKKELATLRILGMRRRQLNRLLITEFGLVSLCGSVVGVASAYLLLFFYGTVLADRMNVPFLLPSTTLLLMWGLACFLVGLLLAPVTALYPIRKMMRDDIYKQYREDE